MKPLRILAFLAVVFAGAALPATAAAQPLLTNASAWQGCGTGASTGAYIWPCSDNTYNSNTTDGIWNMYFSSTGPSGSLHALSAGAPISLNVGTNTLYFYEAVDRGFGIMGLDLGFEGSTLAQLTGWNGRGFGGVNGLSANTYNGSGDQAGAGLSFMDGAYQVTLTSFSWDVAQLDLVSPTSLEPDGGADWLGEVTLEVESTAPEPASVVLIATGLAGVAAFRRRRAK